LPEKIQLFRQFVLKNRIFLPGSTTPPDIKPDWRRCTDVYPTVV